MVEETLAQLDDLRSRSESKKDKCEFFKDSLKFLGHTIDKHGISP